MTLGKLYIFTTKSNPLVTHNHSLLLSMTFCNQKPLFLVIDETIFQYQVHSGMSEKVNLYPFNVSSY